MMFGVAVGWTCVGVAVAVGLRVGDAVTVLVALGSSVPVAVASGSSPEPPHPASNRANITKATTRKCMDEAIVSGIGAWGQEGSLTQQIIELFNREPGLLDEIPEKTRTNTAMIRNRQVLSKSRFRQDNVTAGLPLELEAGALKCLAGLAPGHIREPNH